MDNTTTLVQLADQYGVSMVFAFFLAVVFTVGTYLNWKHQKNTNEKLYTDGNRERNIHRQDVVSITSNHEKVVDKIVKVFVKDREDHGREFGTLREGQRKSNTKHEKIIKKLDSIEVGVIDIRNDLKKS